MLNPSQFRYAEALADEEVAKGISSAAASARSKLGWLKRKRGGGPSVNERNSAALADARSKAKHYPAPKHKNDLSWDKKKAETASKLKYEEWKSDPSRKKKPDTTKVATDLGRAIGMKPAPTPKKDTTKRDAYMKKRVAAKKAAPKHKNDLSWDGKSTPDDKDVPPKVLAARKELRARGKGTGNLTEMRLRMKKAEAAYKKKNSREGQAKAKGHNSPLFERRP